MDVSMMEIPNGWNKLVAQMIKDIKPHITDSEFDFMQIKEKFGGLRAYTINSNEEIESIIQDYEHISYAICSECGKMATYETTGYICPYCKDCLPERVKSYNKYRKINFNPVYTTEVFTKKGMQEIKRDTSFIIKRYLNSLD